MPLPVPATLSPSKVSAFKECPLAFRFATIDRVPEAPSPFAVKGTLVHRALQLLFWEQPQGRRTPAAALDALRRARVELDVDAEFVELGLSAEDDAAFVADAETMLGRYFELEDPNEVRAIGMEVLLEARLGGMRLRGIIDRLELDGDGELVVTDYKTGRSPSVNFEANRLSGVHFYAYLCQRTFGRRPARVQLLYLGDPVAISTIPSEQSIRGLEVRAGAVWTAVERACERDDFRPSPGRLCDWCSFQAWCPAFGGDPAQAPGRAGHVTAPAPAPVAVPA